MAALSTTNLVSIISAIFGVCAVCWTIWTARQVSKPATDAALTQRFTELVDRQTKERIHLERQILKLETIAADLEVMVIKLTAWRDDVIVLMRMRGIEDYPEPPKFNGASPYR
jgi:hypothetical protein